LAGTVQSWDVQHGTRLGIHEADSETTGLDTVAVSSDGELVASAPLVALDEFAIQVWRMASGEMVQVLPVKKGGPDEGITRIAFCSDNTLLAAVDQHGATRIWNLSDGHLLQTIDQSEADAKHIAFSPDCKTLATADDSAAWLWQVSDGSLLLPLYHPLAGKDSHLIAIAFSPDGRLLASVANEGTIRLWGVPSD
jgi:WD40 repeat protein